MSHQVGADDGGTIHRHADGLPHVLVLKQLAGHIEAEKLQNGGICVGIAAAGGGDAPVGGCQVAGQQLHVMRGKGIGRGLLALIGQQPDLGKGQICRAPPEGVLPQGIVLSGVRAGAGGRSRRFCAGFDDGDIQQGGKAPAVLRQLNGHGVAACGGDGDHVRQPGGIAGGLLGPQQCGGHVLRRQRRAVTEPDAAAQTDGIGEGLDIVALALGQHVLRFKLRRQAVQRLV